MDFFSALFTIVAIPIIAFLIAKAAGNPHFKFDWPGLFAGVIVLMVVSWPWLAAVVAVAMVVWFILWKRL